MIDIWLRSNRALAWISSLHAGVFLSDYLSVAFKSNLCHVETNASRSSIAYIFLRGLGLTYAIAFVSTACFNSLCPKSGAKPR